MATTRDILTPLNVRSTPLIAAERRTPSLPSTPVRLAPAVQDFKDRRRRRRVNLQPMYTTVSLRVLARRDPPLEGHAINLSETGIVVEIDNLIPIGSPVTLEVTVAGLGQLRDDTWPSYAVAAEVVRIDDLAEFPKGPYRVALRFVRIPTMTQAQIARFVATHDSKPVA
ncbi:MAG TPA: PilZ domain-containing protein [Phycisphaerae bacterium]|nr:PilZ domain-containing protein [Phycisphaerae bacterium]